MKAMTRNWWLTAPLLLFPLIGSSIATAVDGKWTPQQILELDKSWLQQLGLQLPPARLWDPTKGTGLLAATISTGGCSAAFVSSTGLILTNHHCLFGVVQEHTSPQRNLIDNGFLARKRTDELPSKTLRITIPRRFTDVTKDIEAAVPKGADDLARRKAIDAKQKSLVAACEKRPFARCTVAAFDGGVSYILTDTTELPDVRLVYAPPRSVGEYGGEVDNWMWPRHTGDFSIARAYVAPNGEPAAYSPNNVPYRPQFHLPLATKGPASGDFVMLMGYPGLTYRSLTAAEMAERRELFFPNRVSLYGEFIRIIEETTKGRKAGEIALADRLKLLYNRYKNAQGQIAGLDRGRILDKQRTHEKQVIDWAAGKPQHREALAARQQLEDLAAEQRRTWKRDFLLDEVRAGSVALSHATTLVRAANERRKPDAEREDAYQDREMPRLRGRLDREQANYDIPTDKALLAAWLQRMDRLPSPQALDALYANTRVTNREDRLQMLNETPAQLKARNDSMLNLAFDLDAELVALKARKDRWDGAIAKLRPAWRRAVLAHAGKPVAPDANGTLRVSLAHVKGYQPRDAIQYLPFTTLRGMLEKHTGEEPFHIPDPVRTAAAQAPQDLPVNFLADGDTTGGNSGSPVVNGRGELVGINFDRVWENVANDFGYNPEIARNVSVDVRYLVWMLDKVEHATELLAELFP
jgi:hypothetical protein